MTRIPDNPILPQSPSPQVKPVRRVRNYLVVAAVCLSVMWLLSGIKPSFQFQEVADGLGIHDETVRYRQLGTLGLVFIAIVAVVRVWRMGHR